MQKEIDEMLQKRMDRKDFLKHVAMGVAVITGTAGVVKLMKPGSGQNSAETSNQQVNTGYGASVYGGTQVDQAKKS